jgi:hypothetical protein
MTTLDLSTVTHEYLRCALWSTSDENGNPLDFNYTPINVALATLVDSEADCEAFLLANSADLAGLTENQIGHSLWLTRNGLDNAFAEYGLGDRGDRLDAAARKYGPVNLHFEGGYIRD